ncbi:hypothetical protein Pcaca03_36110 [Pectobacterium carotovorum subsp. carotovorum]|uniref:Uncharacterized protein n=1 Tax=Pectobacterium carotovorum subsp. carotovorum TaxID=555 RepID=A0AAI9L3L6_PECCC|nr:hypothetical protein SOASR016_36170 [Pectobacterium carotovorum subsp. carotovorum]GLV71167.1 hypothetical protein Pcaca03_36110 [Pectobacterium carotovorum subsp. carotovorum]
MRAIYPCGKDCAGKRLNGGRYENGKYTGEKYDSAYPQHSAPYPAAVKWVKGLNLEVEFRCISSDLNW